MQWSIVRRAFGDGEHDARAHRRPEAGDLRVPRRGRLRLPRRRGSRRHQATLDINRRSDQGLVERLRRALRRRPARPPGDRLPAACGRRPPTSARGLARRAGERAAAHPHRAPRRAGDRAHAGAAGRARSPRAPTSPTTSPPTSSACSRSGATIERRLEDGRTRRADPIEPGHVAVLVQTNRAAAQVRDALADHGVPAVINGAGSVFATRPALEWLRLLEALERPVRRDGRARAAALTAFVGWDAERVATADELAIEDLHRDLHDWARVLREQGVAALLETVSTARDLPHRVLAESGGERRLTDLRHVGQLLHAAAAAERLGATALVAWLRRRIAEAGQDTSDEDRSRRLESDARAVQVLTVHRSKGLEFPVVYYPALWEQGYAPEGPVAFHDPDAGDRRTIDVGCAGPAFEAHREQAARERRGEDLRLAYVALTRAQHQAVVWWAGAFKSGQSPLGQLLFGAGREGPGGRRRPGALRRARRRRARLRDASSAPRAGSRQELARPLADDAALAAARFDRTLDAGWRRTSYSDLTAAAHEAAAIGSEPEEPLLADEPAGPVAIAARRRRPARRRSGCAARPRSWPACPPGPPSARSCTACWRRPTSRPRDLRAELAAQVASRGRPRAARPRRPRRAAHRARRAARDAARPARRASCGCATSRAPTGSTSSRSSSRSRAATTPAGRLTLAALARAADRAPAARRPARALRRPARRPGAARHGARLPHRQPRPRAARRRALRGRRLQDELARRAGRAAHRLASPAGGAPGRDAARALRAAGAALHRRAAPLPALARAPATTRTSTSPACSTSSCAG